MHITLLFAQFTADGVALVGLGILQIGVGAIIAWGAGRRGAGVHEERLNNHGVRLDEHDVKITGIGKELFAQGKDIANIKGRLDA